MKTTTLRTAVVTATAVLAAGCLCAPATAHDLRALEATPGRAALDGLVYVPVTDENSVYLIDPTHHTVLKKIRDVGMHPIVLRATPDHTKVYVDDFGPADNTVAVIDTATNTVVKKIHTLGPAYASMAMAPDGKRLYVPTAASVVQAIDTSTDTIVNTFPIAFLPIDIEVTPDNTSFYAFATYGTVARYNATTGRTERPPLPVQGLAPGWAVLTPHGHTLYSINFVNSNITRIDTDTWKVTAAVQLPLDSLPLSATLSPDGTELWVCDIGSYDITVIDTDTMTIKQKVPTAGAPAYIGFSADGQHAYLSDLGPITALPAPLRPLLYSIFYFLPPGLPGALAEYNP